MILIVGTCDTKGVELDYVRGLLAERGLATWLIDVSTSGANSGADVTPDAIAAFHPQGPSAVFGSGDRGQSIAAMAIALEGYVRAQHGVEGAIALGGTGGTALASPALRALPIGVPKMLVSTVASGNVAPYIGASDISLVYSITDICGLNRISRVVLANAAHALAGMVQLRRPIDAETRETIGLTMFGVTTPCVQQLTAALSDDYDCLVFHATGTGGQSFEKLVDSGLISAGLDVTTTEVCDLLVGGVFAATEDRFGAFIRTGVPYIGSCGALDMVNFGAMETVPPQFRSRTLHVHNPQVTLMRTSVEECAAIGAWIGERLNAMTGEVRFLIPEGGVSLLSVPGQPFHDPAADQALFDALTATVRPTASRRIERLPHHINSPEFVAALLAAFQDATDAARQKEMA